MFLQENVKFIKHTLQILKPVCTIKSHHKKRGFIFENCNFDTISYLYSGGATILPSGIQDNGRR